MPLDFTIGGKARPGKQTENLKKAGFSVYEAVIARREDWNALEEEARAGLFPTSIDLKGKEEEQRWIELLDRLNFLSDLGKNSPFGAIYVAVDGFKEKIERLQRLRYEHKAIEALPATSPAALEANTAFPKDLITLAQSAESKVLIDICHLFQTGVYLQSLQKPLDVTCLADGTYSTKIPPESATWYYGAVQEIIDSGYLAPVVHTNGHVFVAEQKKPETQGMDQRVSLPDGRIIKAFDEKALTLADWQGNQPGYEKFSYALPIMINGKKKVAQWFKSHTFITDGEDEMYTVLDPQKSMQQLVNAGVKALILENNKESSEKLKKEAEFFYNALRMP
ncbi:hypothetical protein HYU22_00485 [Candidatus Woesearchaeota archaeon]|nr:hypothetical protein [Candidatus Woesearchaeota archaeon]